MKEWREKLQEEHSVMVSIINNLINTPGYAVSEFEAEVFNRAEGREKRRLDQAKA